MKNSLGKKWLSRILTMKRIIYVLNHLPLGYDLKWKVCEFLTRNELLPHLFGPCPVCKRIWYIDCHTIPSPTCGSGDCEDKLLIESNEYYRKMREEERES